MEWLSIQRHGAIRQVNGQRFYQESEISIHDVSHNSCHIEGDLTEAFAVSMTGRGAENGHVMTTVGDCFRQRPKQWTLSKFPVYPGRDRVLTGEIAFSWQKGLNDRWFDEPR
jgi:hypothetical protein